MPSGPIVVTRPLPPDSFRCIPFPISITQQRSKGSQLLEPMLLVLDSSLFFSLHFLLRARHVLGLDVDDLGLAVSQNRKGDVLPRRC